MTNSAKARIYDQLVRLRAVAGVPASAAPAFAPAVTPERLVTFLAATHDEVAALVEELRAARRENAELRRDIEAIRRVFGIGSAP